MCVLYALSERNIQMGSGIAQTCAQARFQVVNIDIYEVAIDKAKSNTDNLLSKKIIKGTRTEDEKLAIINRLTYSNNMHDVKSVDIIVEAVPKQIDLKKSVFKQLD